MPALNFMKEMAPLVESGKKRQTIRARRKDGKDPRAGQTLYHYTGMRTKGCRKLGQEICKSSLPIQIDEDNVVVAGNLLYSDQEVALAKADGFESLCDFREFFVKDGQQFDGFLIKW